MRPSLSDPCVHPTSSCRITSGQDLVNVPQRGDVHRRVLNLTSMGPTGVRGAGCLSLHPPTSPPGTPHPRIHPFALGTSVEENAIVQGRSKTPLSLLARVFAFLEEVLISFSGSERGAFRKAKNICSRRRRRKNGPAFPSFCTKGSEHTEVQSQLSVLVSEHRAGEGTWHRGPQNHGRTTAKVKDSQSALWTRRGGRLGVACGVPST